MVCITPQITFENIQPLLEATKTSMLYSIARFMSIFSFPLLVLLILYPAGVNVQPSAQKGLYFGTILGGIVLITLIVLSILVLGPENTSSRTFPSYALAQRISIGNFCSALKSSWPLCGFHLFIFAHLCISIRLLSVLRKF